MKKYIGVSLLITGLTLQGCAGCNNSDGNIDDTDIVEACDHPPEIVRTEFDPKDGKVPFDITFNVLAEDEDDVCQDYTEILQYQWDFDGDGQIDRKTKNGKKIVWTCEKPGDYKAAITVVDAKGNKSEPAYKHIKCTENKPPVISMFRVSPNQTQAPAELTFEWIAGDPDGSIVRAVLDIGDGSSPREFTVNNLGTGVESVTVSKVGALTAALTVYDDAGASQSKSAPYSIYTTTLPSSYWQTVGSSQALALNDNNGQHFGSPFGPVDYLYVADGPIGLKSIRIPIDAYGIGANSRPAELVGMADPAGPSGNWTDVVTYKNLAIVAGTVGLSIFNVSTDLSQVCENPWDTNCYPGTPTAPAAVCSGEYGAHFFFEIPKIGIITPSNGSGNVYVAGLAQRGSGSALGGMVAMRIDRLADNKAGYVHPAFQSFYSYDAVLGKFSNLDFTNLGKNPDGSDKKPEQVVNAGFYLYDTANGAVAKVLRVEKLSPSSYNFFVQPGNRSPDFTATGTLRSYKPELVSDCWQHSSITTDIPIVADDIFDEGVSALEIDGDWAYVGKAKGGFEVVDLGSWITFGGSSLNGWRLSDSDPAFIATEPEAHAILLTESKPVVSALLPPTSSTATPQRFTDFSYVSEVGQPYFDCEETRLITFNQSTFVGLNTKLATTAKIYPGNRVAVRYWDSNVLDNGGAGYLVVGNDGSKTIIEGQLAWDPATATTTYPFGVSYYAILPSYPGSNPVTFTSGPTSQVAQNGRCLNFVNAYGAITQPVGVTYSSAPLAFAAIEGNPASGIFAFDRSNPAALVNLTCKEYPAISCKHASTGAVPRHLAENNNRLYASYGSQSRIDVIDVSDPYHLKYAGEPNNEITGTFKRIGSVLYDFDINEMIYHVSDANPDGSLLIAGGRMGLNAVHTADRLTDGTLKTLCEARFSDNSYCMTEKLPALQLRHDGIISDIQLVEDKYALVAQMRGGVLVFDISGVRYGADPTFVSHVRTLGSPEAVRYITDTTGTPYLFIADDTSLYSIDFSDPRSLDIITQRNWIDSQTSGYICVDPASDRVFACAQSDFSGSIGLYLKDGFGYPDTLALFGNSTDPHTCVPDSPYPSGGQPVITRVQTDYLAGRLFLFATAAARGAVLAEVALDGSGNPIVMGGNVSVCQWKQTFGGAFGMDSGMTYYLNKLGTNPFKRLYTINVNEIALFDMDAFEASLADPEFQPAGLTARSTFTIPQVQVSKMSAVGPYLFLSAGAQGGYVIDASDPIAMQIVGRTAISAPGMVVNSLTALSYPNDPDNPSSQHTYLVLAADNNQIGGIRLLRFPNLQAP